MKIPKGTDIRVDTQNELVELHITAAITTKAQANELAAAIKSFSSLLEGEKRPRKPKVAPGTAAAA
jgi:hypothetical protein